MTINEINAAIISGSFTNDELTSIVDAVKFARSRVAQQTKNAITLGTQVRFTDPRNGRVHMGTVNKIKVKNILVQCATYGGGGLVNVPASMLSTV
jgi:hypothetical protein